MKLSAKEERILWAMGEVLMAAQQDADMSADGTSDFVTVHGVPTCSAIRAVLDEGVSSKQRDKLWKIYREGNQFKEPMV